MDEKGRNLGQVHQPLHQQPYYPSAGRRNHPGGVARQVDDANVKMVSPAWVPGGYAQGRTVSDDVYTSTCCTHIVYS